jgi:RsiW-degrading membrane proteinase PrsW (M82 family)
LRFLGSNWFRIFGLGLIVFLATEQALKFTGNPNFFPTVILLGALLVPVTFISYIYDHIPAREISLSCILICFLGGGVVGIITAGILEYSTLQGMTIAAFFGIGLIEEACKLIFPLIQYFRGRYRSEADGVLFGIAAGMGFAALETMGYGMVTLIESQGSIGSLEEVLLVRGLLSPAGHAAWTGLVCAVLWRTRERKGRGIFTLPVLGTFVLAIALHALWDMINSMDIVSTTGFILVIAGNVAVAIVSLVLLMLRVRQSRKPVIPAEPAAEL